MWRRSWLSLVCAGLLAVLAGCNVPTNPPSSRERPSSSESDKTPKPPDGGVKPPKPDPG